MIREQLIQARKERGWSQERAALEIGVGPATIKRWEAGLCFPHPNQIREIEKVYNRDIRELGFFLQSEQKEAPMTDHIKRSMEIDVTSRILRLVWSWTGGHYEDLQKMVSQEIKRHSDIPLTRRQALTSVILLPIGIQSIKNNLSTGEKLAQIATGITACWYERRGANLQTAHDATGLYIDQLKKLLPNCTEHQKQAAAEMIMQCYILKGTLLRHFQGIDAAIQQVQKALPYSELTRSEQEILALRTIAGMYEQNGNQEKALLYGEQAAKPSEDLLTQSYTYSGLANYQASVGKQREARQSLEKAKATFFAASEGNIWVDHSLMNLNINAGETYHHLGEFQSAAETMDEAISNAINLSGKGSGLFERCKIEILRNDKSRDLERVISLWSEGLDITKEMGSKWLLSCAQATYQLMLAAWQQDKSIKELKGRLA